MTIDYFPTPRAVADACIERLSWQLGRPGTIWDVGSGPKAVWGLSAKQRLNPEAKLVCVDPYMEELHQSVWGKVDLVIRKDFLSLHPSEQNKPDLIVCNPPYSRGLDMRFVAHALRTTHRYALFFLSLRRLEGKARYYFWEQHPPAIIHVYAGRLRYGNGTDKNGRMAVFYDLQVPKERTHTHLYWINLSNEEYDARKE